MPPNASIALPPAADVPAAAAALLQAGKEIGANIGQVRTLNERVTPFLLVPDGKGSYRLLDTKEQEMPFPKTIKRLATFYAAESFCHYVNEFKADGGGEGDAGGDNLATRLFAEIKNIVVGRAEGESAEDGDPDMEKVIVRQDFAIRAILDDHPAGGDPAWGDHNAWLKVRRTESWRAWLKFNNAKMGQETFAEFIEDHFRDIVTPTAAKMLEIASDMRINRDVKFASSKRLSDGRTQFEYIENQTSKAGNLEIPEKIVLALPLFEGMEKAKVEARFRFRLQPGGGLALYYSIAEVQAIERAAYDVIREDVAKETKLFVHEGSVG